MVFDNYRWHYNYVRLAWDSGFSFEKYKRPNADKNKICAVDIDRVIKERDVALVDHHISTIVEYALDNEQAEVLDMNFVKIFRMGQLAVEYLLFCKKYLDNTVVLLKKDMNKLKEEYEELKSYSAELELLTKTNLMQTFKCDKCSKLFSTEDYLQSHIKRRHNPENNVNVTDILHIEVKTLKERLNETEKYLKDKNEKNDSEKMKNTNEQVLEIQDKFDKFKQLVEEEINKLQAEKKCYEEKYNSLFNVIMQNMNKDNDSKNNEKDIDTSRVHLDTMTQTESGGSKLKIENTQNKNIYEFQETDQQRDGEEVVNEKIEEKINQFSATIESKISSGFTSIEQQLSSFLTRLQELEAKQTELVLPTEIVSSPIEKQQPIKPQIKPRTKLTQPSSSKPDETQHLTQAEKLKNELDIILSARRSTNEENQQINNDHDESCIYLTDSDTSEDSSEEIISKQNLIVKDNLKIEDARSSSSRDKIILLESKEQQIVSTKKSNKIEEKSRPVNIPKQIDQIIEDTKDSNESLSEIDDFELSEESIKDKKSSKKVTIIDTKIEEPIDNNKISREVHKKLNSKLQNIGIASEWKGIPKATFLKALDIVNHQAKLKKKMYPDFDVIRRSIEKSILKKSSNISVRQEDNNDKTSSKMHSNLIKVSFKRTQK